MCLCVIPPFISSLVLIQLCVLEAVDFRAKAGEQRIKRVESPNKKKVNINLAVENCLSHPGDVLVLNYLTQTGNEWSPGSNLPNTDSKLVVSWG